MRSIAAIVFALICGATVALVAPGGALADLLKAGDMAPQFSTGAIYGEQTMPIKLSDYRGQIVALYFYPKDFTPGCTTEACTFRDSYAKIKKAGIVLLGCSVETADSIARSSRSTACRSRCCSILTRRSPRNMGSRTASQSTISTGAPPTLSAATGGS